MKLFNFNNAYPKKPTKEYDKVELLKKEKDKVPMTYDELAVLQNEKKKELTNQILRVAGLFTILTIVILAIGCFLYPYSIFNLFGKGDKFWDCWNNMQYHLTSEIDINTFVQKDILGFYHPISDGVKLLGETNEVGEFTSVNSIWVTIEQLNKKAFTTDVSSKVNFIALGAWSIIPLASMGLVAIIVFAAYICAYNIKDLIHVIKHFVTKTGLVVSDISANAVESVESTVDKPTPKPRKPRVKKTTTEATLAPLSESEKTEEDKEAEEIAAKMAAYKEEIANEDKATVEPVVVKEQPKQPTTSTSERKNINDLSDDELDKMLGGK